MRWGKAEQAQVGTTGTGPSVEQTERAQLPGQRRTMR